MYNKVIIFTVILITKDTVFTAVYVT
jgi:hypothetical protein